MLSNHVEMKNTVIEHLDAAWVQIKTGNRLFAVDNLYWAVLELATAGRPTGRDTSSDVEMKTEMNTNKLANTYLDAVDSLLDIYLRSTAYGVKRPDDLFMIVSNLAEAVRALQNTVSSAPYFTGEGSERALRFPFTDETPQRENPAKSLTLDDLKKQVDLECTKTPHQMTMGENTSWLIGDFEIGRRK